MKNEFKMKVKCIKNIPSLVKGKVYDADYANYVSNSLEFIGLIDESGDKVVYAASNFEVIEDTGTEQPKEQLKDLSKIKAGDWVYDVLRGWFKVDETDTECIKYGGKYWAFESGKPNAEHKNPTIYTYDPINGTEPPEREIDWSKVPVDTPVLVRDDDCHQWCEYYFAGFVVGFCVVFNNCDTSEYADEVQSYKHCKLNCKPKEDWYKDED